jgi:hypothetical protein
VSENVVAGERPATRVVSRFGVSVLPSCENEPRDEVLVQIELVAAMADPRVLTAAELPVGVTSDDVVEHLRDGYGRVVDVLTWGAVLERADQEEAGGDADFAAEIRDAVADADRDWILDNVFPYGWTGDARFAERGRDGAGSVRAFVPRPTPSVKKPPRPLIQARRGCARPRPRARRRRMTSRAGPNDDSDPHDDVVVPAARRTP